MLFDLKFGKCYLGISILMNNILKFGRILLGRY